MPSVPFLTASEAVTLLAVAAGVALLLLVAETAHRRWRLAEEVTRKTVHIGTGVIVFLAPFVFERALPVLLISGAFTVLNAVAYARRWIPSVHHAPGRRSFGTVYYTLALFVLTLLLWDGRRDLVIAGMAVLAIGDGLAGAVGQSLRSPTRFSWSGDMKSVEGSVTMFLASLAALHVTALVHHDHGFAVAGMFAAQPVLLFLTLCTVALAATAIEALSGKGLDNLFVPLVTAGLLALAFTPGDPVFAERMVHGAGLGLMAGVLSWRLHLLSDSGAAAAAVLAVALYTAGGWPWTVPMLAFFLLSSLLSRTGSRRKQRFDGVFEKGSRRDQGQVFANGGVATLAAVLAVLTPWEGWTYVFLGALAAVTADTWGTEIGVLASGRARSILSLRSVPAGTSGGVSPLGTLGGAAGAAIVTAAGIAALQGTGMTAPAWSALPWLTIAGVFGSAVDSVLGATVQARYRCGYCNAVTERRMHCHLPTELEQGRPWLDNDVVNIACAAAGAAAAVLVSMLQ